jgi:signal transduction histidine kinase
LPEFPLFLDVDLSLYIPGLLLTGALLILFVYHFFLYVQYKERIILFYSCYLFSLASYIGLYLYARYYYPGREEAFAYYLEEIANIAAIIFYCLFLVEAVAEWKNRFPLLFKSLDITIYITVVYCILLLVLGMLDYRYRLNEMTMTVLAIGIRVIFLILAIIAVPLLFPLKADVFIKMLKWGASIYLVMILIVMTATVMPSKKILHMDAIHWFFIGTLIDIVIFSIAMGFKIKSVFSRIMEMRNKISQDLHDEVGATLSGIALYSHLAQQQIKEAHNSKAEQSLDTIKNSAAQMVDRLSDIVWAVNPKNDSLPGLMKKVEEYALEMATVRKIKVKTNITDRLDEISLPMEYRKNIYLICKESINNAIKYSQGSDLLLEVMQDNRELDFVIADNGTGFDHGKIKRGNGLDNMLHRAAEMNADLDIFSEPGKGTTIRLKCKIT